MSIAAWLVREGERPGIKYSVTKEAMPEIGRLIGYTGVGNLGKISVAVAFWFSACENRIIAAH